MPTRSRISTLEFAPAVVLSTREVADSASSASMADMADGNACESTAERDGLCWSGRQDEVELEVLAEGTHSMDWRP